MREHSEGGREEGNRGKTKRGGELLDNEGKLYEETGIIVCKIRYLQMKSRKVKREAVAYTKKHMTYG